MSRMLIFLLIIALVFQIASAAIPIPKAPAPAPHPPQPEVPVSEGPGAGEGEGGGEGGSPQVPGGGAGWSSPPAVPFSNPAGLGLFSQNGEKPPFTESETKGSWEELLEKARDILENISSALDSPTSTSAAAFTAGPPVTTTFKASEPSNACNAWASLTAYCNGSDTGCGCYSRSYYVPDQWNSLAARCANATGTVASGAAKNTAYCTANIKNATSTVFAAVTPASSTSMYAYPTSTAGMLNSSAEKLGIDAFAGLAAVMLLFVLLG